jgi:hypothetical protein
MLRIKRESGDYVITTRKEDKKTWLDKLLLTRLSLNFFPQKVQKAQLVVYRAHKNLLDGLVQMCEFKHAGSSNRPCVTSEPWNSFWDGCSAVMTISPFECYVGVSTYLNSSSKAAYKCIRRSSQLNPEYSFLG